MRASFSALQISAYVIHAIGIVALALRVSKYPFPMTAAMSTGGLISLASISTVEHRPLSLFVAFGVLAAPAFWLIVSAVHFGFYVGGLPAVLLLVGAAWLLKTPEWPPLAFTAVVVLLMLAINAHAYQTRFDSEFDLPEDVVRFVISTSTMLVIGLAEAAVGFAMTLGTSRPATTVRKSRKKRRSIATPED